MLSPFMRNYIINTFLLCNYKLVFFITQSFFGYFQFIGLFTHCIYINYTYFIYKMATYLKINSTFPVSTTTLTSQGHVTFPKKVNSFFKMAPS